MSPCPFPTTITITTRAPRMMGTVGERERERERERVLLTERLDDENGDVLCKKT